jgi:hypothetical protein
VHGNYVLEDVQLLRNTTEYSTTTSSLTAQTLTGTGTTEGVNFISITTGSSTSDLLEFVCDFGCCRCDAATSGSAYMGFGMQRSASTNMSSPTVMWRSGEHTWGGHDFQDRYLDVVLTRTHTVADWSLAANTTYKINLIGMTHSPSITAVWGLDTATNGIFTDGFKLTYRRWRLL